MKRLLVIALLLGACGDIDDAGVELDVVEQGSSVFDPPYQLQFYPVSQGSWSGSTSSKVYTRDVTFTDFWSGMTVTGYWSDDRKINLTRLSPHHYNTCVLTGTTGASCNGSQYTCPASAWLANAVAYRPTNTSAWIWGSVPGFRIAWDPVVSQGPPQAYLAAQQNGNAIIGCQYPMAGYYLTRI